MFLPDYFKILGVRFGASEEEIKTAYRKLSKKFHPDLNQGDQFFEEKFKEIQEAYEILTDPVRKEEYIKRFKEQEYSTKNESYQQRQNTTGTTRSTTVDPGAGKAKKNSRSTPIITTLFIIVALATAIMKFTAKDKKNTSDSLSLPDYKPTDLLQKDTAVKEGDSSLKIVSADTTQTIPLSSVIPPADNGEHAGDNITVSKDEQWMQVKYNDVAGQIEITPVFTISNAKGLTCHATAYFYDSDGIPLKTENRSIYTSPNGSIASSVDFTPAYESTRYNYDRSDFTIVLPYSKLYLSPGDYTLQFRVVLFDDQHNTIENGELNSFTIRQN